MEDFLQIKEKPLVYNDCYRYEYMAFDGEYYYFLILGECIIERYSCNLEKSGTYTTKRVYNSICYDYKKDCFYASSKETVGKIFVLNDNFVEVDCINLSCDWEIVSISFNCAKNALLVATSGALFYYYIKCNCQQVGKLELLLQFNRYIIKSCLSIAPNMIITLIKNNKQYMQVYKEDCLVAEYCIPFNCMIKNIIFNPCDTDDSDCDCDCNSGCGEHNHKKPQKLYYLVNKKGCYPYIFIGNIDKDWKLKIDYCNYFECHNHHHRDTSACNDIIESVALMEAALSHIINAEGEKLQKVLKSTDDINKILDVNKSINQTLTNALHLEHVLYNKLELASECEEKCKTFTPEKPKCSSFIEEKQNCSTFIADKAKCTEHDFSFNYDEFKKFTNK